MDFPEKKAGSMDPVTVAKKTPRPVDVRAWALFTACATAFSLAVGYSMSHAHALDHFHAPCWQWQFSFLPCDHLTDADKAVVNAVCLGKLSCIPVVAAGPVLAPRLLLPPTLGPPRLLCRRRWVHRALACLELALTIVGHCLRLIVGLGFVAKSCGMHRKDVWVPEETRALGCCSSSQSSLPRPRRPPRRHLHPDLLDCGHLRHTCQLLRPTGPTPPGR